MNSNKIYLSLALLIVVSSFIWISSCTHDTKITDQPIVCFEGEVLPVFLNSCAISGCHNGGGNEAMSLINYTEIRRGVVPGNPNGSEIYNVITDTWGFNRMPPKQPLSLENRMLIRVWIEQGAEQTVCPDLTTNPDPPTTVPYVNPRSCFSRDILPVLVSRCATTLCHDAITHKSGYNFTNYTSSLSAVRAGNPTSSKLYQVIKLTSGEEKMPPVGSPQLSTAEKDSISKWISYGALNENCGEVCDTINPVTFSAIISPAIQTTCAGCHSGTSPSGNVLLASYSNIAVVASSGLLVKSLKGQGVPKMPPSGSLTACKIRQFELWVNNGFLNN